MARTPKPKIAKTAGGPPPPGSYPGPVLLRQGRTGLKRYNGYLNEEWHPKLKGQRAAKIYREMQDNDPIIGGALWLIESILQQADIVHEPPEGYEDSTEAKNLADWFNDARDDMESTWPQVLSEISTMCGFGYAVMEMLFKRRRGPNADPIFRSKYEDGLWGWRDWAPRAQESIERWDFVQATGAVRGFYQRLESDEGSLFYVPLSKCLHFKLRSRKKSPEPPGLLRHVYRPYYFTKRHEELEGVAVQRQAAGFLALYLPWESMHPGASGDDKRMRDDAEDLVERASADALSGMVFVSKEDRNGPTGFGAEFLTPTGDLAAIDPIIKRGRQDKAVALLVESLLLGGQGGAGSRSLATNQTDLLALSINGMLRGIAGTIDEVAVPCLGEMNSFPREILPNCHYAPVEMPDIAAFASALSSLLASGGVVGDDQVEQRARDILGIKPRRGGSPQRQMQLPLPPDPSQPAPQPAEPSPAPGGAPPAKRRARQR